jgi:hypothetical protein
MMAWTLGSLERWVTFAGTRVQASSSIAPLCDNRACSVQQLSSSSAMRLLAMTCVLCRVVACHTLHAVPCLYLP